MKRFVSLGLCFAISLILVFGSITPSSSPFITTFAADMPGDSMGGDGDGGDGDGGDGDGGDNNQGGDSGNGDDNNNDGSDSMPKDAPLTTGALTAGGDSDNDDDDDDDSGRDVDDEENDNDNDNDNEITPKDLPVTVDAFTVPYIPYRPPAAALPYHGNEIELIASYDKHDIDAVKKYDTKGPYAHFTFNDGTIKEGTYGPTLFGGQGTELRDIKITPGPGTQLDKLGVKDARLPFSGLKPEIHYKDGNVVTHEYFRPSSDDKYIDELAEKITTMNKEGKELETVYVDMADRRTYAFDPIDSSHTEYKEDGNYIKEWPVKTDGTQQFYDSKQQKVFVRDADGNIIPPKER
jgi:hypothetical protein